MKIRLTRLAQVSAIDIAMTSSIICEKKNEQPRKIMMLIGPIITRILSLPIAFMKVENGAFST